MYQELLREAAQYFDEIKVLKRGARGTVTLLRHRATGKRYVFRCFDGSADVYQRLLTVDCPHLPRVEEVAASNGRVAVLEEYVQGDTLLYLLEGGLLDWSEAKKVTEDICAALWVLHSMGAVHRDVKESNVILRGGDAVLWAAQPLPAPLPDTPAVSADAPEPQGLAGALEADSCQTWYEGADGRLYHVFACFSPQPNGGASPASHRRLMQPAGEPGTSPLCVFVEDAEDSSLDVRDAFAALMDRHTVVAVPAEGSAACIIYETTQNYADAGALFAHEHQIDSSCTYNDIIWTLYMKNGDEITLRQVVECQEQPTATYSWEDIPLTTTAELQALLDRLAEEVSAETDVTVLLPATTYDEPLRIRRLVQLQAHADGTTFTAPVTVECLPESMQVDMHVVLRDCRFLGQGGTGVTAHAPTYLKRCRLSGWDVGALAADNGWIWVQKSEFTRNGVALCIDTNGSSSWGSDVHSGSFVRNGTAVRLVELPGDWMTLRFHNCTFYGNTTVLDNVGGVQAELDPDCAIG